MPKTVYAAKVEDFRRRILQQPQQHKRIALLHGFLGLGRLSRIQIQFCIARIDELRAELPPNSADMMLLDSLSDRVDAAWKRHDRRQEKREAERLAAKPADTAPPPLPVDTKTQEDYLTRLLQQQKEKNKEKSPCPAN